MFDQSNAAGGAGLRNGARLLRRTPPQGNERGDDGLGRGSESISNAVFGTGSLSALIVLKTPGNTARVDPVEGSGAPLLQNRSCETRRGL